ncbi:MAG: SIS domain-containing protein [Christensenellaceae bacterium]|jgi:glucosamine--fructose-6-phosphate aminotransferase (isomerizing)|nr:SIS domain-containing protein [Christensenellaceae bacterium]
MCGIFGVYGSKNAVNQTLDALEILQYRGYDSAGLAYIQNKKIKVIKSVGDITKLRKKIAALKHTPKTNICIGHTRWATNGMVNQINSHPHLSFNNKCAVIHNGIIENYEELKDMLLRYNIKLKTPVDTEVIPNLLWLFGPEQTQNMLKGKFAVLALSADNPDEIISFSRDMPLISQNNYYASDILAFPDSNYKITKNGYKTFMEKEINEIPDVIEKIKNHYQNFTFPDLSSANCVHIIGCGTSYHAALIIGSLIEKNLKIRTKIHIASEFNGVTILSNNETALVISQSGETADTIAAIKILQSYKLKIISICNVLSSTIAKQSDLVLPMLCGPEIAVASTKAFAASICIGSLLATNKIVFDFTKIQTALPIKNVLSHNINKIFFIGNGLQYYFALEAALKVKEITYMHCEGYPSGELKHGTLSLVNQNTLAIFFGPDIKTKIAVEEIRSRGGKIMYCPNIISAQLFALRLSEKLDLNPDRPRNLAKSVTVE